MNISVNALGSGNFAITGSGFLPNHVVHIRIVDDVWNTVFRQGTSDANGQLSLQINVPCIPGLTLHFSANDERWDPSARDTLWSNYVHISCA